MALPGQPANKPVQYQTHAAQPAEVLTSSLVQAPWKCDSGISQNRTQGNPWWTESESKRVAKGAPPSSPSGAQITMSPEPFSHVLKSLMPDDLRLNGSRSQHSKQGHGLQGKFNNFQEKAPFENKSPSIAATIASVSATARLRAASRVGGPHT